MAMRDILGKCDIVRFLINSFHMFLRQMSGLSKVARSNLELLSVILQRHQY